jgi:hypothetical protein
MEKYTQKELKSMVLNETAIDLTNLSYDDLLNVKESENGFQQLGYSSGIYGCNGALLRGYNTKKLYVITSRNRNLFVLV